MSSQSLKSHESIYEYSPLRGNTIRLVEVLPSNDRSIECQVHLHSLNGSSPKKDVSYTALSYCWGAGPNIGEIKVDGKLFFIRGNLWHALQAIKAIQAKVADSRSVSLGVYGVGSC